MAEGPSICLLICLPAKHVYWFCKLDVLLVLPVLPGRLYPIVLPALQNDCLASPSLQLLEALRQEMIQRDSVATSDAQAGVDALHTQVCESLQPWLLLTCFPT